MRSVPQTITSNRPVMVLLIGLLWTGLSTPRSVCANGGGNNQDLPTRNSADILFQSMCSGGGTKGILDVNFPVKISWRCSRCGRKTEVTVPLVKTDNTDSIAKKIADAINPAVAGSSHVSVTYYQSSQTQKQDQNWYRIRFTGVDQVDAGAWHSKLKLYVITWPSVLNVSPGPLPENVTPGKPGRTLKPGKELKGEKKKRQYTGPDFFGWKETHFSVGLYPWSQPNRDSFVPYRSYRFTYAESDPNGLIFDKIEDALASDGFQVRRFDDTHLAVLGGPDGAAVTMMSLGTYLNDPVEKDIDQEEHWTVGDIVSSSDDQRVDLTPEDESELLDRIQTGLNDDLSSLAKEIARLYGLTPWAEYPGLLAQEPWEPDDAGPDPIPDCEVMADIAGSLVTLEPDLDSPDPAHTYWGCVTVWMDVMFPARLAVEVTPTSPAYGTWSSSVAPEVVLPGEFPVEICIRGEGVNIPPAPAGSSVIVAEATIELTLEFGP